MTDNREIMIGDYADVTFIDPDNISNNVIYRYYVEYINKGNITISQINDRTEAIYLIFVDDKWQIDNENRLHSIAFNYNVTDTRYVERDFTQAPSKIIVITEKRNAFVINFTELKNGIILFLSVYDSYYIPNSDYFPISKGIHTQYSLRNNSETETFGLAFSDPNNTRKIDNHDTAFDIFIGPDMTSYIDIMNLDNEIFIYQRDGMTISKLYLDNFTTEEYDHNDKYQQIFPLKHKQILCQLWDNRIYILDLFTKQRIPLDTTAINRRGSSGSEFYQLSNGNIIDREEPWGSAPGSFNTDLYLININTGITVKIASFNQNIYIISPLQDDTLLLWNADFEKIQILDFVNSKIIDIGFLSRETNFDIWTEFCTGELLHNGDVLFIVNGIFYLFNYANKQIITLPSFADKYIIGNDPKYFKFIKFQQLKNGNLLIFNGRRSLSIIEFPPLEIDKLFSNLNIVGPPQIDSITAPMMEETNNNLSSNDLHLIDLKDINRNQFNQLLRIANDPEVMQFIRTGDVWTEKYIQDLINYSRSDTDTSYVHKAILLGNDLIGYIGLRPYREYNNRDDNKYSELRIFLDKNYQRKGYAQRAFNMLNSPVDIMSCIHPKNQGSIALMNRLGFKYYKAIMRKKEPLRCYIKYHP